MMRTAFWFASIRFVASACLLSLAACSDVPVTRESIQRYISDPDNRLTVSSNVGDVKVEVQYKPTDFLVDDELYAEQLTRQAVDSLRKKYSNYYYFVLRISKAGADALYSNAHNDRKYRDLVQTLSFEMDQFVAVTTSRADTFKVADFALDRTHGAGDATTLIFVFARQKEQGVDWIQFNLGEFGLGIGNQRFRFRRKDLEEIPVMDFGV